MLLPRREFLASSAALAAGVALAAEPQAAAQPIIDTHQHLWDLDKFSLPWLSKDGPIGKNFVTKDYLAAIAGVNIVGAVYMEVDVAADQKVAEAEYVLKLCDDPRTLTVAAVIGGRIADAGFRDYVARFKDEPRIKGVRQVLNGAKPGECLTKEFVRGVQTLGEFGKSFDICTMPALLGDAAKLVAACPDTRFILDHCGNGSVAAFRAGKEGEREVEQYRRDIATLAKHDRVVCKISGVGVQLQGKDWGFDAVAPVINTCLDAFGPDRVMFASDWPVCTLGLSLKAWVEGVQKIVSNRSAADQRKLFHDNAVRQYKLSS
ncbi:MAG TPA: amidohydrolase family protein [Pirellulaceae bacterium]|nr:amidohydrolase family protein [Pirellulaceae bacterium]